MKETLQELENELQNITIEGNNLQQQLHYQIEVNNDLEEQLEEEVVIQKVRNSKG